MAKKRVEKTVKAVKKTKQKVSSKKQKNNLNSGRVINKKLRFTGKELIFFLSLFVIFVVFNVAIDNEVWDSFLRLGVLIFGSISVAILISYLILWFMKKIKRK